MSSRPVITPPPSNRMSQPSPFGPAFSSTRLATYAQVKSGR